MTTSVSSISLKVLTFGFLLFPFFTHTVRAESYAAFGNYTLGSARVLGLGGAYTSISDDSNAFFYNPAGPALSEADFQFDAATNRLNNDELYLDPTAPSEPVTSQFELIGGHYKKGRMSFGVGYLMPYFVELQNSLLLIQSRSLKVREVGANVSYAVTNKLAVGINGKYSEAIQTETSGDFTYEMNSQISYWQFGVIHKDERWSAGYSYSPELRWKQNSTASSTFKDVASPQKHVLGFSYFIKPNKVRAALDIVNITKIPDTIAYESNFNFAPESIKAFDYTFIKLGVEFLLIKTNRTNAQFRLGFYEEPSRFTSNRTRRHVSIGFEVRLGPALLQIAQDQADGFNNTSQALSVVFDEL